ncbi:hypothetical protein ABZP36_030872 [Zizania latifolia]
MDPARPRRVPVKSRRPDWREEVRSMPRLRPTRPHLEGGIGVSRVLGGADVVGLMDEVAGRQRHKDKLRINCLKRVKEERVHLLWKNRTHGPLPSNDMVKVKSSVRDIISDELEKLKNYEDGKEDQQADMIWEYQEPQAPKPDEAENEDILLEMERLLYEDLREEFIQKELEALDDEEAYLAQAVFDHMQLDDKELHVRATYIIYTSVLKSQLLKTVRGE